MTEVKTSQDPYAELREHYGKDGHLVENIVSLIAYNAAKMRKLYRSDHPLTATFAIDDAASGRNPQGRKILENLTTLGEVLRNKQLQQDAFNAGFTHGNEVIQSLDKARNNKDVEAFKRIALSLTLPRRAGEKVVTLADKIQAQNPVK